LVTETINTDVKQASILLVDDEAANIKLLERLLQNVGYSNIVSTQDPRQVLNLFAQHHCDLLLLDLNMPYMDGYEVMAQLNSVAGDEMPTILMLTAQHAQEYKLQALDNGAIDYVTKPFDSNELLSRLNNLLKVHMAQKLVRNKNDLLEQMVQERTKELHDTRLQVVRRLGRAAEYRDNETGLHIIRMSKVSALLGKAAGMDEYDCDLLLNAAPMHDIGKIGIADHILLKPGRFEPAEWTIMQTHSQIGADILSDDDSDLMKMAGQIALTHHEKWNGKGYPNGLAGKNIPLVGRVCALADVFDALTSVRPYKKAWSVEDSVNLIKEERGQHFDPQLVDYFLELLPEILIIKEKYAEPEQ